MLLAYFELVLTSFGFRNVRKSRAICYLRIDTGLKWVKNMFFQKSSKTMLH